MAAAVAVVGGLPAAAFAAQPASSGAMACDGACPMMASARADRTPAPHGTTDHDGDCLDAPQPALDCCGLPTAPPTAPAESAVSPSPQSSGAPASDASHLASAPAAPPSRVFTGPPRAAPAPHLYTLHSALLI